MDINLQTERTFIDVPYKQNHTPRQVLDLYYPQTIKENMPVFVYIHGGGFLWYDKSLVQADHRISHIDYRNRLLQKGFVFVSVEYPILQTTEHPCLEGQIADVKDAIKWLKINHDRLHINPDNIGLWGLSAGGALALACAINPDDFYQSAYPSMSSKVQYVIDFYGITDIFNFYHHKIQQSNSSKELHEVHGHILTHTNIDMTKQNEMDLKEYLDIHSPITHYRQSDIFISIYHGTTDDAVPYIENALAFYNKGIKAKNNVFLHTYQDKEHGFWWDTKEFYITLENTVISEVLRYSNVT